MNTLSFLKEFLKEGEPARLTGPTHFDMNNPFICCNLYRLTFGVKYFIIEFGVVFSFKKFGVVFSVNFTRNFSLI